MNIHRYSAGFIVTVSAFAVLFVALFVLSAQTQQRVQEYVNLGFPVLHIVTENGKAIKSKETYLDAQCTLTDGDTTTVLSGKIRGRGNSTWDTFDHSKKSYLLKLDEATPLLDLPATHKWVLLANIVDKTSLRNVYAYHLGTDVWNRFDWTPQTRFIFVTVNNTFFGLYALTEKVEIAPHHVDVPVPQSFLAEVSSIHKEDWDFVTTHRVWFTIDKQEGRERIEDYQPYQQYLQHVEDVLFGDDFTDPEHGWQRYLDADSWVDWYIISEFSRNNDSKFLNSCYMYYDDTRKKLFMGPLWDYDIAFGNISYNDCEKTAGWHTKRYDWYKRLFEDPYFVRLVQERWNDRRAELEQSFSWLAEKANELTPAAEINDLVWRTFGRRQWPNAPGYRKRKTYQDEIAYLTDWLTARAAWIDQTGFAD